MRRTLLLQACVVVTLVSERPQLFSAEPAGGGTTSSPVVLVAPLDGNPAQVPCWSPAAGQALAQMLVESLEKAGGKFQVLAGPEPGAPPGGNQPGEPVSPNSSGKPVGAGSNRPGKPAAAVPTNSPADYS